MLEIKDEYFTIPNLVTCMRLLLVMPFMFFLFSNRIKYAFIIILLIALTELDGVIARLMNSTTEYGEYLDFIVDEVTIFILFLTVLVYKKVFNALTITWLVANAFLVFILTFNYNKSEVHNKISKFNVVKEVSVYLSVITLLYNFSELHEFFTYFSTYSIITLIFSFILASVEREKMF